MKENKKSTRRSTSLTRATFPRTQPIRAPGSQWHLSRCFDVVSALFSALFSSSVAVFFHFSATSLICSLFSSTVFETTEKLISLNVTRLSHTIKVKMNRQKSEASLTLVQTEVDRCHWHVDEVITIVFLEISLKCFFNLQPVGELSIREQAILLEDTLVKAAQSTITSLSLARQPIKMLFALFVLLQLLVLRHGTATRQIPGLVHATLYLLPFLMMIAASATMMSMMLLTTAESDENALNGKP